MLWSNSAGISLDMNRQRAHNEDMSTTKQISFYNSLLDQIALLAPSEFAPETIACAREAFPARAVGNASQAIERAKKTVERLKAAAPAPVAKPAPVVVADGHYALTVEGVVKFYQVNSPTVGKWAGYTFVNAQASDDYHKIGRQASADILAQIAVDPAAAMKLYGTELGVCGHCGRTLTSDWRKVGIGPVCIKKMGW